MAITRFEYSILGKSPWIAKWRSPRSWIMVQKTILFPADQGKRASVSVPSNIAEGSERPTKPDGIEVPRGRKGFCNETRSLLTLESGNA
ncbi:MAG: four helix bundle protein [Flavobacteriales bacterium]|nr:four helix bundle protein [Flavobacteriales bacterium]